MTTEGELLDNCLHELESSGLTADEWLTLHPAEAEGLRPLLGIAERYRLAPRVAPSREFRASARSRMLNLIAAPLPRQPADLSTGRAWPRLRWLPAGQFVPVALSLLVLLIAASATVAAASVAPPSSPLYSTRLALEDLRVRLAAGDAERAELHLAMAEARIADLSRMEEVASAAEMDRVADLYLVSVSAAVQQSVTPDSQVAELIVLDARLSSQEEGLRRVLDDRISMGREIPTEVVGAVGFLDRQRANLRQRVGVEPPVPSLTPTPGPTMPSAGMGSPPAGPEIPSRGGLQPPSGMPIPSETATLEPANPAIHEGDPYRWGQPEPATPTLGTAEPSATPSPSGRSDYGQPNGVQSEVTPLSTQVPDRRRFSPTLETTGVSPTPSIGSDNVPTLAPACSPTSDTSSGGPGPLRASSPIAGSPTGVPSPAPSPTATTTPTGSGEPQEPGRNGPDVTGGPAPGPRWDSMR